MGFFRLLLLAVLCGFPIGVAAQDTSAPEKNPSPESDGVDTLIVQGVRQRGAVLGDIKPDTVLTQDEIAAYGVSNLSELFQALEAETGSSRGRSGGSGPVVLLNGRRISGFREIGRFPSEAIERVEILPEEAALQYGFKADQRVINFILKKNFSALTLEAEASGSEAGGRVETEYEVGKIMINGPRRWNLSGEIEFSPPLTEAERDIISSQLSRPFDTDGNISALTLGDEIDSDLSAQAGDIVTVAAVPTGTSSYEISDFASTANMAAVTDVASFRTLRSEETNIELDAGLARDINEDWGVTLSAGLDINETTSLQGLSGVKLDIQENSPFNPFANDISLYRYATDLGALTRQTDRISGNLSLTANRQKARWVTTITANARFSETETFTDRQPDISDLQSLLDSDDQATNPYTVSLGTEFLQDTSKTVSTDIDTTVVMTGPIMDLETGEVRTTLTGEINARTIESESSIENTETRTDLSRESFIMRGSLDIPLFYAEDEENWGIGDLTLNLNGAVDDLSDFGALYTYGYGLTWQARERLRFIISVTEEDGAPGISQLGNPREVTDNVRVYDYVLGETVLTSRVFGGNPDLQRDHRRVFKIGTNWKPFEETNLTFRMDYTDNLIEDPVGSISTATAEIQAALPERFVRDTEGDLVLVDTTPFNFAESQSRDLRSGFVYSKQLGQTSRNPSRERSADGRGSSSRGGTVRRRSTGSFRLSVYHTYVLEDRIFIRDGIEEFDLLGGSSISGNGGRSAHRVSFNANLFNKGLGIWANGVWESESEVFDPNEDPSLNLTFSDLATVNVNFFVNFDQREKLIEKYPFLKTTRLRLYTRNLFDARQRVRDGNGEIPQQYQADLLDPIGRSIGINLRKSF